MKVLAKSFVLPSLGEEVLAITPSPLKNLLLRV
jgi:hypothetical protein